MCLSLLLALQLRCEQAYGEDRITDAVYIDVRFWVRIAGAEETTVVGVDADR